MENQIIIGIHCGYRHDSGAALIINNEIKAAISEERLTRIKKDPYFPKESIKKCLEIGGISIKEVNHFAFGSIDIQFEPYFHSIEYFKRKGGYKTTSEENITIRDHKEYLRNRKNGITPFADLAKKIIFEMGANENATFGFYHHHMSHMASVYFTSGKVKESPGFIFVIDGGGDGRSGYSFYFENNNFPQKILNDVPTHSAPGTLYRCVTIYLGMKPNRHEGKVTGLAAFGDHTKLFDQTKKYLFFDEEKGEFIEEYRKMENKILKFFRRSMSFIFNRILGMNKPNFRGIGRKDIFDYMKKDFGKFTKEDIAAAVQKRFDDEILKYIKFIIGNKNTKCILLTGGVFANVRTNGLIADSYPNAEIYVHPGMTDEGIALGAALMANYEIYNNSKKHLFETVYLGSNYDNQITNFVSSLNDKYLAKKISKDKSEDFKLLAEIIKDFKVIGLFQGAMEYGPRALGNRTILANPTDKSINDTLNNRLHRTEYMPFAPIVLAEFADDVFELSGKNINYACNFMTSVTNVRKKWRDIIPAVVHVDNTARPQIIRREQNPFCYDIIKAYYDLTGIPLLINTSFNIHEEPIVESPTDALISLELGCVDYLCFHNWLIATQKSSMP